MAGRGLEFLSWFKRLPEEGMLDGSSVPQPSSPILLAHGCSAGTCYTEQGSPGGALSDRRLFRVQGTGAENQGSCVLLHCCSQVERSWAGLSPRFASVFWLNGSFQRLGNARPRCGGRKGEWENPPGAHPCFPPRASKEQTPTYPREKEGIDILVCKTGSEGYICATLKPCWEEPWKG